MALDRASVMARCAEGAPEVHITGAADQLLGHLMATEAHVLGDASASMALARIGARSIMSRIELDEAGQRVGYSA